MMNQLANSFLGFFYVSIDLQNNIITNMEDIKRQNKELKGVKGGDQVRWRDWTGHYERPQLLQCGIFRPHPLPGLVFEEGSYHGVESVDVPGLVHKVDPSKSGWKTVLLEEPETIELKKKNQANKDNSSQLVPDFCLVMKIAQWPDKPSVERTTLLSS